MVKAGLIAGAGMFILVLLAAAVFSPLCALCVPLLAGIVAGYLTGRFEMPPDMKTVATRGAYAGAIAAGLGIIAQMIAMVINALVMQNPQFQVNQMLGLPPADPTTVWVGQFIAACCVGLLNVALTAGFGAAGGAIWFKTAGESQTPTPPPASV
ncbi:MAG: hypothetical protein D6770_09195 [Anaerolineae bacterium]|nr:MAG: hypothetical protein D6770_09195 [Anaerolineae bacterium]